MISDKLKVLNKVNEYDIHPDFTGGKMNIEISSGCNEDCIYCIYAAKGLHKKRKCIDEDFFYRVTKEAFDLGIEEIGLYMMGEPLTNPNIYKYVEYLKKEVGFKYVYISTNGLLCNQENIRKLAEAGIDSIKFSVSACTQKSFITHHGIDAFEVVLENIKNAHEYRCKHEKTFGLYLFYVLTRQNMHEEQMVNAVYGQYVDEIIIREIVDDLYQIKGVQEYLKISDNKKNVNGVTTVPCPQLFNRIIIDETGFLCTCCYAGDNLNKVINVENMTLADAVYSKEMEAIRRSHLENNIGHTICNRCINHVEEIMQPFSKKYGFEPVDNICYDRLDEMVKRFGGIHNGKK